MQVSAKAKLTDKETGEFIVNEETGKPVEREVIAEYEFGETIHEMITALGEESVYHHAKSSMVVALQNLLRQQGAAGATDEEIKQKVEAWEVPNGKPRGRSKIEKLEADMAALSPEAREAIIAKLS